MRDGPNNYLICAPSLPAKLTWLGQIPEHGGWSHLAYIPTALYVVFTYVEHTCASLPELQYARSHPQSQTGVQLMRDGPKSYARRPHSTGGLEFAPKLLRMALWSHLPHTPNAIRIMRE